ncbi:MAG: 4-hydroxy-tetrahydrodipicolinate reductase [Phycisphaera sp.]|nr:4-hydroxy-tetrahydrodipicolinate reductase [Phycisphaera sp.]
MTRVAIAGAAGRMGQRLCALAGEMDGLTLSAAFERPEHAAIGKTAADNSGVTIGDVFKGDADVLIDFTTPAATRALLPACVRHKTAYVIGTTGLTDADHKAIDEAAKSIAIVQAPNMSLGVNLLLNLVAQTAKQLGDDYDIEILEAHHRYKKDAPSGTALAIADSICKATGKNPGTEIVYTRHGDDVVRDRGKITMQTLRMGDTVGEHTAYFSGLGERLELTHIATTRDTFARGALRAAKWLSGKPAGRYTMKDVLGLT